MNQAVEAFKQHIDLSRTLGTVAITGFEALVSAHFDHAQSFAERSGNRVRTALSKSGDPDELAHLPKLVQEWIGNANILVRDAISSSIDYQLEMVRLMQQQAAETREVLAESLSEPFASKDHRSLRSRRAAKTATVD